MTTNPIERMTDEQLREEARRRAETVLKALGTLPPDEALDARVLVVEANARRARKPAYGNESDARWWRALDQAYREAQP